MDKFSPARKKHRAANPPTHEGYFICHYGKGWIKNVEVDHKDGRKGALMNDPDNLVDSCHFHNTLKGSRKYDAFIQYLTDHPEYKKCIDY